MTKGSTFSWGSVAMLLAMLAIMAMLLAMLAIMAMLLSMLAIMGMLSSHAPLT